MLKEEFKYYLEHQDELLQKYNNRSNEEALIEAKKIYKLGDFLIQKCTEGDSAYTQKFHSRVKF